MRRNSSSQTWNDGTKRILASGESEQILNNRQKKMEALLPEAGMIEKEKNETRFGLHLQRATPKSGFFNPGSRIKGQEDPGNGSASKNLSTLTQKLLLSEI